MKTKVVLAILAIVWLLPNAAKAQTYAEEALILSRMGAGGTARIQALGGAQTALGGDLSAAGYNPAGLGMFNRSEIQFTPGYIMAGSSSNYLGGTTDASKTSLVVNNLGLAFHSDKGGAKGLWGGTFAVNYNRVNDFNNTFTYTGLNKDNSIIDYFISDANGTDVSQFNKSGFNYNTPTGLSYFNYLIGPQTILSPPGPADQYFTDVYPYLPTQTETVKTSGSQSQWNFSYGLNYNDKIFLGFGIGMASFRYKSNKSYTETFLDPYTFPDGSTNTSPMSKMVLTEDLSLSGSAINATIGAIFRPVDMFQFGLSVATPSSYSITDMYSASMTSQWNNFEYTPGNFLNAKSASTDNLQYNYYLTTPWRFSGGMAFFYEKKGFVTVDVEMVDYSTTHYSSDLGDDWSADNQKIKDLYKSVVNLRLGAEYRLKSYRFRAGFNEMQDPFKSEQNGVSRAISTYSVGAGYRQQKFYVDLAVLMTQGNNSYRPYTLNSAYSPLVQLNNRATTVMVTVGIPF